MNWFWFTAGGVLIVALAFLALGTGTDNQINFTDLETECRYDRATSFDISLKPGNRLAFDGNFPVNNTEADLSYKYRKTGNKITLNIVAKNETSAPVTYLDGCLASVVYHGQTESLEDGRYEVVLRHDGREVERQLIGIK